MKVTDSFQDYGLVDQPPQPNEDGELEISSHGTAKTICLESENHYERAYLEQLFDKLEQDIEDGYVVGYQPIFDHRGLTFVPVYAEGCDSLEHLEEKMQDLTD